MSGLDALVVAEEMFASSAVEGLEPLEGHHRDVEEVIEIRDQVVSCQVGLAADSPPLVGGSDLCSP